MLLAGGDGDADTASAELGQPSTGACPHEQHVFRSAPAILLKTGKVLIAGGVTSTCCTPAPVANPELYDPATDTFTLTGTFAGTGDGFFVTGGPNVSAAALLPDGRVLIAGEPISELYDPATGTFQLTGVMTTPCVLGGHPMYIGGRTATPLANGLVLLTGGAHEDCGRFANAELYDVRTGTFTPTGSMTRARDNHAAALLPDGRVLITGGESHECSTRGCVFSGTEASSEIFDPSSGSFTAVEAMSARRATSPPLANGTVLVTGGYFTPELAQARAVCQRELYTPSGFAAVPVFPCPIS